MLSLNMSWGVAFRSANVVVSLLFWDTRSSDSSFLSLAVPPPLVDSNPVNLQALRNFPCLLCCPGRILLINGLKLSLLLGTKMLAVLNLALAFPWTTHAHVLHADCRLYIHQARRSEELIHEASYRLWRFGWLNLYDVKSWAIQRLKWVGVSECVRPYWVVDLLIFLRPMNLGRYSITVVMW